MQDFLFIVNGFSVQKKLISTAIIHTSLASLPFSLPFFDGALSPGFPPSFCMRSAEEMDTYIINSHNRKPRQGEVSYLELLLL